MKFFIQISEDFSRYFVDFALIRINDLDELANRPNVGTKKKPPLNQKIKLSTERNKKK